MKPQQFFYSLIGGLTVLALALGIGYYKEIGRIKTETLSLQRQAADATLASEQLDQLHDLKQQYQAIQPVLEKLNIALPPTKNQSEVILQIQQLAANAGMTLPSASFQASSGLPTPTSQTVKSGDALALPLSFQLSGSYAQLQTFLQAVENLGRYSSVSSLAITRSDVKASTLVFSITLNVYVKP